MPASDSSLPRRYWLGLAAVLLLVCPVVLFNVVVNPIGEFGPPRRYAFNRTTPRAALEVISVARATGFYDSLVSDAGTDRFIIGDSRIGLGTSSCGSPMGRVIGLAWNLREFDPIVRRLLSSRRRTTSVFLQLPVLTEGASLPPVPELTLRFYAALSPYATQLSLKTVAANARQRVADASIAAANCHAVPASGGQPIPAADIAMLRQEYLRGGPSYADNLKALAAFVAAADEICARQRLRHRLVLFRLPLSYQRSADMEQMTDRTSRDVRSVIAPVGGRSHACAIEFVDWALSPPGGGQAAERWRDPNNWIDQAHFKESLGNPALAALIDTADHPGN
jgi:hypothetical protein